MRRLMTRRLPGDPPGAERVCWWDFRSIPEGWTLEIPWVDPGGPGARPSVPAQAEALAVRGLTVDSFGRVVLDLPAHAALLAELDFEGPPWAALDALDAMTARQAAGDLAGALQESVLLRDHAPGWAEGRRRRLHLLLHGARDADAAEADLDSIPGGTLPPDELRRERQTLSLLRDDWVAYAGAQAEMIADGAREPASFEVLGLAFWAAGQLDRALQALHDGLQAHPGHRDLALRTAEVLEAQGQHEEALSTLEGLSQEGPPHSKTLALRGWLRRQGDPAAAAADWAAALDLDPEQAVARVGRGLQRLDAGDLAGARADLAPFTHCGWTEAADAWARYCAAAGEAAPGQDHGHDHSHDHEHDHDPAHDPDPGAGR